MAVTITLQWIGIKKIKRRDLFMMASTEKRKEKITDFRSEEETCSDKKIVQKCTVLDCNAMHFIHYTM